MIKQKIVAASVSFSGLIALATVIGAGKKW